MILFDNCKTLYTGKAFCRAYPYTHLTASVLAQRLSISIEPGVNGLRTSKYKSINNELAIKKRKLGVLRFNLEVSIDLSELLESILLNYEHKYKSKCNIRYEKKNLNKLNLTENERRVLLNELVNEVDRAIESGEVEWLNLEDVDQLISERNIDQTKKFFLSKRTYNGRI